MEITEIKVFPVEEEKLKAFVSIIFDRCFMVNDIKVIRGRDGYFISMPSRRKRNGKFKDVAHPLNNETRQMLERQILTEYERVISERGITQPPAEEPRVLEEESAPTKDARDVGGPEGGSDSQDDSVEGKSLEEVAEIHLRDSYWTT